MNDQLSVISKQLTVDSYQLTVISNQLSVIRIESNQKLRLETGS